MSDQNTPRSTADWLVELCIYAPIGFALDAHKYVPEFVDRGRNQVALARFLGKFALDRIEGRLGPLGPLLRSATPSPEPTAGPAGPSPAPAAPPVAAAPAPATAPVEPAAEATEQPKARRGSKAAGPPKAGAGSKAGARRSSGGSRAASSAATPSPARGRAASKAAAPAGGSPPRAARGRTRPTPAPDAVPQEAQLAIEGYGSLSASQIVPRLATLDPAALDAIDRFEAANRARRTILNRVAQLRGER